MSAAIVEVNRGGGAVIEVNRGGVAVTEVNHGSVELVGVGTPGPGGPSDARSRRYDEVQDGENTVFYIGTAPIGSLDSAAVWTIERSTINGAGDVLINEATAVDSPAATWDDRLTEVYA